MFSFVFSEKTHWFQIVQGSSKYDDTLLLYAFPGYKIHLYVLLPDLYAETKSFHHFWMHFGCTIMSFSQICQIAKIAYFRVFFRQKFFFSQTKPQMAFETCSDEKKVSKVHLRWVFKLVHRISFIDIFFKFEKNFFLILRGSFL